MAHLKSFGLENFRVFKKQTNFEFAPISIITGTNSSGKSSVIKALLLLKNNFEKSFPFCKLDFTGDFHHLGTYEKVIHNNTDKPVSFIFPINLNNTFDKLKTKILNGDNLEEQSVNIPEDWQVKLTFFKPKVWDKELEYGVLQELIIYNKKNIELLKYQWIEGYEDDSSEPEINYTLFLNIEYILSFFDKYDTLSIKLSEKEEYVYSKNELFFEYTISKELDKKKTKSILKKFEKESLIKNLNDDITFNYDKFINKDYHEILGLESGELSLSLAECIEKKIEQHNELKEKIYLVNKDGYHHPTENYDFIFEFIYEFFSSAFENIFSKEYYIDYLPSVRGNIHRLYTNATQGTIFNQLLLDYVNSNIQQKIENEIEENRIGRYSSQIDLSSESDNNDITPLEKIKEDRSCPFINYWLNKFDIGTEIKVARTEGTISALYIIKDKKEILLADLGFGITQILPILMKISLINYNFCNNSSEHRKVILLIEEPEANLHPKFQSMLADMFIDANKKFNIQFIIETHSEYLIRKLQYLSAKKEIKAEDTVIYYLNDSNKKLSKGEKQVKKININEDGSLTDDFGEGFYDEATNLKFDLLKLKNAKN